MQSINEEHDTELGSFQVEIRKCHLSWVALTAGICVYFWRLGIPDGVDSTFALR